MERFSLGCEPAIYVPRAIFIAVLSFYCYSKYGSNGVLAPDRLDFPEIKAIDSSVTMLLYETNGLKYGRPVAIEAHGVLCALADLLRRIGHWEIARNFASILDALTQYEASEKD